MQKNGVNNGDALKNSPSKPKVKKVIVTKGAKKTEEFKKAYRQFYDDVKISDREDW